MSCEPNDQMFRVRSRCDSLLLKVPWETAREPHVTRLSVPRVEVRNPNVAVVITRMTALSTEMDIKTRNYPTQQAFELNAPDMAQDGWTASDLGRTLGRLGDGSGSDVVVTWTRKQKRRPYRYGSSEAIFPNFWLLFPRSNGTRPH